MRDMRHDETDLTKPPLVLVVAEEGLQLVDLAQGRARAQGEAVLGLLQRDFFVSSILMRFCCTHTKKHP